MVRDDDKPVLLIAGGLASMLQAIDRVIYGEAAMKYFNIDDFVGLKHAEAIHKLMGRGWSRKDATWLLQASRLRNEFTVYFQ